MKKVFSLLITAFIAVASFAKPDFTIPQIEKYANADECRKDNDIALKTANFYLDAELPADIYESRLAAKYMFVWVEASDEILFTVSHEISPFLRKRWRMGKRFCPSLRWKTLLFRANSLFF